ncbi:hypothetical protein ACELLULO517_08120 [Acidisoma cellulosilytica]|uniref:Uncharacterized protein n=1 Tax=Acidisoma cellulosilyticum TaxID=2802395 RepID=A0A963Z0C3_9PROT|nr:hypothetical protein [Acidisoma cellulosilyticum]MCB8880194.1 hypothetical protein [Acidisoma cellulosilyticum]
MTLPAVGWSFYPGTQAGGAGIAFGKARRARTTRPILDLLVDSESVTDSIREILPGGHGYDVMLLDDFNRRLACNIGLRQARFCGWSNFRANPYSRAGSLIFVAENFEDWT